MISPPQPAIEVLLATFNGEPFLRAQLDSILAQDAPNLHILARDDGSSDATPAILAEYAAAHPTRIRLLPPSPPTGSPRLNFLALMQAAHATSAAPCIAFSDQDDVWLPHKLSRSLAALHDLERRHPPSTPLLVFTDLRIVDANLETLDPSLWSHLRFDPRAIHSLPRLLGSTVVTGSTMLINRAMLALACRMPPQATMHDRWIGLLAASLGDAAFLPEPTVLYRQHARNVIGAAALDSTLPGLAARATNSSNRRAERLRSEAQATALHRLHGASMPPANRRIIELYLRSGRHPSALARVALTLRHGFFRGTILRNLALLIDLARHPTTPASFRASPEA